MSTSENFDLIVIGAGVFGTSTACEAARRGKRVLTVERGPIPNPVGASFGPSRKIRSTYQDPHYSRLAQEAMLGWRSIEDEVGAELYVAIGNISVAVDDDTAHLELLERNARTAGARIRRLDQAEVRREFPQFRRARHALLELDAGFVRATDGVSALRTLAERSGARFEPGCAVRDVKTSGERLVVATERGSFEAPQVVLAGGGWSAGLLPELRQSLWQCQQGIMYVEGVPDQFCRPAFVAFSAGTDGFYGFPAERGQVGLKVARHQVTDPIDDPDFDRSTTPDGFAEQAVTFLREDLGLDASSYPVRFDSCMYNLSSSNDFLLDFHPSLPGLFVATAGSGHGYKFGSVLGKIVVDRLDGVASDWWSPQFSFSSFLASSARPRLL